MFLLFINSTMALILNIFMLALRAILTFTRPVSNKILDVVCRILYGGTRPLPPIDNKILLMSATEIAEKIRKKQISATEVMQCYINRIKAVQPAVNAYVDSRFEEAVADAKAVDKMLDAGLKSEEELATAKPLLGVPFSCKEIIGVKDLAQTCGMMQFKERKAPKDAEATAQYRRAGAIPVVVTNIPTMLLWWDSENPVFGKTRNPFDNNRTAGGSSGGEASLITSAGAVIGIGNDLGGSIRIPSAFCGIYGHKPSQGVVSNKSSWPGNLESLNPFISTGPMCRYVEDLPLLVNVLNGDGGKISQLNEKVDFKKVKIYYMDTLPGALLSATSDVRKAVRKATKHFENEFHVTATELHIEELKFAFRIWQCKAFEAAGAFFNAAVAGEKGNFNVLWEYLKCLTGSSDYDYRVLYFTMIEIRKKDKAYYRGLAMYNSIQKKLQEVLDGDAILIMPSHPEPPPHCIATIPKFFNIGYTCLFNILGFPATNIPAGLSEGLPIGIQAVGAKNKDNLTIAAAIELDKIFNGWRSPCPVIV